MNPNLILQEAYMPEEIKREYKDRLFKLIFGREEYKSNTLQLYNAISGSSFTDSDSLEINTIEDAVYLSMHNDVSFIIADTVNLFEHQSSFSPNIPMRMLFYVSQLFQKMLDVNDNMKNRMYTHSQVKFPNPKFYVFFNGPENEPEQRILDITECFINPEDTDLQLKVTMFNINYGRNKELMAMCAPLSDYSQFVHDVTKYKYEGNQSEAAVNRAIDGLPEGIVKDIISAHRAEATDMFLTEYDEELTHRGFYEVGVEDGMAEGIARGMAKGEAKGKAEGKAEANLETARTMLADGMPEDKVAKYTSLPIEEVRKLKKN